MYTFGVMYGSQDTPGVSWASCVLGHRTQKNGTLKKDLPKVPQFFFRLRRMLGLFVFFYALLHFAAYAWLDQGADWADISADIAKRPFIVVGVSALLLLAPLAATSFNAAQRWLGAARWRALHRAVYLVAVLAVLHFFWMRAGKRNFTEVAVYASVLAALLAWRVREALRQRASRRATSR